MTRTQWVVLVAGAMAFSAPAGAQKPDSAPSANEPRRIVFDHKPHYGDFEAMLERRVIRVLVPYSRTLYFTDKGHERGLTAELARDFERYINRKHAKRLGRRPITVIIIPTTRDMLLPNLVNGLGDIAAGNLTETAERLKIVDFVAPEDRTPVRELLVTGPSSPPVATVEDLSGKTVHVRPSSSYHESLVALNERLARAGKPPVVLGSLPDVLEDEDVMEMLNAGSVELAVVDSWKALLWAKVLPKIKVREDIVLRSEGHTGWAIRQGSPQLQGALKGFYTGVVKKQGVIEIRLARYHKRIKQIANNTSGPEWKRFERTIALFRKYGARYNFDYLMLTAQGFQESRLDQNAKSHVGAVGIMQIMPATGAELKVGDIGALEPNIHGGAKYMDRLISRYFAGANFSDWDRTLFAFASYNAGPGNISRMRRLAEKRGLDPDRWFNNVEIVTAEKIGMETTTYVRNICKYYAAYKLTLQAHEARQRAKEAIPVGQSQAR